MSKFLKVKCGCGNEQTIFAHSSSKVGCLVCSKELAAPTGAQVKLAEGVSIVKVL